MKLPEPFEKTFLTLMGEGEAKRFFASFDESRTWGLRVNTLKLPADAYLRRTAFNLHPVPWARDGFSHDGTAGPGRHPDYHAGLYYLQDPGAMLPAELLEPKPGERVLDACAAPGGKTVQLAAMMRNKGFLLANDISPKRVKPLRRNLEGLGVACAAVSNEDPTRLASLLPGFFDAILLDVPCSGEGMFRKDDTAVRSWKRHDAAALISLQRSLVEAAHRLLRPGGRMVYATCTYNPEENERNIAWALETFPDLDVIPAPGYPGGLAPGRSDWCPGHPELAGAVRVWPHLAGGEGQFAVLLRKAAAVPQMASSRLQKVEQTVSAPDGNGPHKQKGSAKTGRRTDGLAPRPLQPAPQDAMEAFEAFCACELSEEAALIGSEAIVRTSMRGGGSSWWLHGTGLYWQSGTGGTEVPHFGSLRLEMPGLYVGEWASGRFEPSSALLHALTPQAALRRLDFHAGDEDLLRYLHGETVMREGERGWTAVLADGYPLGWGKQEDGFVKNRYPKGWRML